MKPLWKNGFFWGFGILFVASIGRAFYLGSDEAFGGASVIMSGFLLAVVISWHRHLKAQREPRNE